MIQKLFQSFQKPTGPMMSTPTSEWAQEVRFHWDAICKLMKQKPPSVRMRWRDPDDQQRRSYCVHVALAPKYEPEDIIISECKTY